jgi:hypothetical protein
MPIRHQRSSVSAGELLVACVAVVDDDENASRYGSRYFVCPILGQHGDLYALAGFGMNGVTVKEFQFLGERRKPGFAEAIVFEGEMKFAVRAENFYR